MYKRKAKICYPDTTPKFTPSTDTPLRYFSTKRVFVRKSGYGNHKLYCDKYIVAMVSYDNFLYLYKSYDTQYEEYVEAFLHEYAPSVSFSKMKHHLGSMYYEYIGSQALITV